MGRGRWLVGAVFVVLVAVSGAFPASADDGGTDPGGPGGPVIAVTPTTLSIDSVDGAPPGVETPSHLTEHGTARPVLLNTSATGAAIITAVLSFDQDTEACKSSQVLVIPRNAAPIGPHRAEPVVFTIAMPENCAGQTGTLIVNVIGGAPTTVPVTITKTFTEAELAVPISAAIRCGLLFLVLALLGLFYLDRWEADVRAGPSWSFKDSWATNLAAIGGVLATVLSATGLVELLIPGRDTDRLAGLNILFLGVTAAAPVIYAACSRWTYSSGTTTEAPVLVSRGRACGAALAAAATIAGVTGQLWTIRLITVTSQVSDGVKHVTDGCVGIATVIVFGYGLSFVLGVSKAPANASPGDGPAVSRGTRSSVSGTL